MGSFPMCINLTGRRVLLVGNGPQIREKEARLLPFGAELIRLDRLAPEDFSPRPAMVVAGDLPPDEAGRIAALCEGHGVPVNVVDQPRLCSFTFPAMALQGEVTVAVSTGGRSPAAAVCLRDHLAQHLPERTGEILDWLARLRADLRLTCPDHRRAALLQALAEAAFARGDVLSPEECRRVTDSL